MFRTWRACGLSPNARSPFARLMLTASFGLMVLCLPQAAPSQVSPQEVLNPRAKSLEKAYLPELTTFNQAIQALQFRFPFLLRRYVGLSRKEDPAPDTRGLQFLKFHDQIVLKISGDYQASFNGDLLTRNQRAAKVFANVVIPVLQILPKEIPTDAPFDALGVEISYHVRSRDQGFDYEGVEDLVVILNRKDAFQFSKLANQSERQEVLNRSQVYINNQQSGLALGERDSIPLEALGNPPSEDSNASPQSADEAVSREPDDRLAALDRKLDLGLRTSQPELRAEAAPVSSQPLPAPVAPNPAPQPGSTAPQTQSDVSHLQAQYQAQLDTLAQKGAGSLQFVSYAPPAFVLFRNRTYLQITLRNPYVFETHTSSIYKRAAQSFDLYLAPQLKALLSKIPQDATIAGLDVTVLNELGQEPKGSSEAAEFICPIGSLQQFANAEITNQDLINQSIVLVNGVRIALNLQQVE